MRISAKQKPALVWIVSGLFLVIYSGLGLLDVSIPGVEELVKFINSTSGMYLYAAAFLAIFFEGLYIVGNFIPGSTLVLLLAIFAQAGGTFAFLGTILAIFVGWCLAGAINIFLTARILKQRGLPIAPATPVRDRILTTWYPAFRANYEVAQVVSGIPPLRVFWSSLRVKIWASLGAAAYALILPFIIDMNNINNEEGFATVLGVSIICIGVGVWQLRNHSKPETDNQIKNADTRL